MLPPFNQHGHLPPGDYELTLDELRCSMLVRGPATGHPHWDAAWRLHLVESLAVMVGHLWAVGISEIFVDGSFAEDKDHPNDIDGYFVCDMMHLATGRLERELNLLDPQKAWTWSPAARRRTSATQRRSCPCGTPTASSSIRTLANSLVSPTNTATSWSFRPHSASHAGTDERAASSRFGGHHDSQ
jgi:hypothetical protein